jgi:polyferredoxin
MIPRSLACLLGFVGGGAWVLRFGLDLVGDPDGFLGTALEYAGLLLLLVALFAAGAGLVKQSTTWLRVVVGIAFPLLVWSVVTLAYPLGEVGVQALAGVVAIVVSGWVMVAAPRSRTGHGRRAARRWGG